MNTVPGREELYEQVWSVPMIHLGKRYGMLGPELRKICVNLAIPIPERGHWAKLAAGHKLPRPALPALVRLIKRDSELLPHRPASSQSAFKAHEPQRQGESFAKFSWVTDLILQTD
jgi:hypothetical protein